MLWNDWIYRILGIDRSDKMKVLFLITARGGSKGVPRKNIKKICDIPLVAYKIIAARKSNIAGRIIVSTDDMEIAQICREYGAEVPFMRPKYLAEDYSNSMDVVEHAMKWISENDHEKYDYICLLEPSSPFSSHIDIRNAFEMLEKTNADTLLSVKEVEVNTAFVHTLDAQGGLSYFYENICKMSDVRRQTQPTEYTMNGCMYIAKWEYFEKNKLFHSMHSIPYIMPAETSIEIDTMWDYQMACWLADNKMIDLALWS